MPELCAGVGMGTWGHPGAHLGPISLLLHLGWETVFLLEALAVPGSSGEERENEAWVAEGNTRRADCSLAREARVNSLGWFLLACWGLPGSLKTDKGGGPSEGQSAQGRRGGGLHTCLVTSDLSSPFKAV